VSNLVKATLQKIRADEAETPDGEAFPVQFNPSSLKIRITNQIEGGRSTAKQVRQQTGNSSRTLTLDLLFDTADEGSTDAPVSVRDKTKQLEQFISTPENNPDPPPKLKFHWGDLTVVGIADSIDVSLEHFAANGYPLRAKVSLSIKEQDPHIVFQPGNRGSSSAQPPGGKAGAPGAGTNLGFSAGISAGIGLGLSAGVGFGASAGVGLSAGGKIGFALEGEMGAEFAARMGVDPTAWRGLDADLGAGLSLSAGTQVGFNPSVNSSPGIGVVSGVNSRSDINDSAASALNLSQSVTDSSSVKSLSKNSSTDPDSAGKAMTSLGGVDASINAVKIQQSQQKTQSSVIAFGMGFTPSVSVNMNAANAFSTPSQQGQTVIGKALSRSPLNNSGAFSASQAQYHQPLAPPDSVDFRATTFGQGIPLQPLFGASQTQQLLKVYSNRDGQFKQNSLTVPFSTNLTTPGWIALPQRDETRQSVDVLDNKKHGSACQPQACQCGGS
jgi:hypothetical protein